MMNIAHSILETVQKLPQDKAQQVLDFAEFLQQKEQQEKAERSRKAIEKLREIGPLYTVTPYTRDELYDRQVFR